MSKASGRWQRTAEYLWKCRWTFHVCLMLPSIRNCRCAALLSRNSVRCGLEAKPENDRRLSDDQMDLCGFSFNFLWQLQAKQNYRWYRKDLVRYRCDLLFWVYVSYCCWQITSYVTFLLEVVDCKWCLLGGCLLLAPTRSFFLVVGRLQMMSVGRMLVAGSHSEVVYIYIFFFFGGTDLQGRWPEAKSTRSERISEFRRWSWILRHELIQSAKLGSASI